MTLKHSLCTAALAVPLLIGGAGPSAADADVGFSVGLGSPYYGMYPYDRYYGYGLSDPFFYDGFGPNYGYGLADPYVDDDVVIDDDIDVVDDMDEEVIEPAAASPDPAPCVKTNVKNFKNACPS
jgi:hypothetical protein